MTLNRKKKVYEQTEVQHFSTTISARYLIERSVNNVSFNVKYYRLRGGGKKSAPVRNLLAPIGVNVETRVRTKI